MVVYKFHFYLYGGPQNFFFIYMVVHKISLLLFIWWFTKFRFHLYGGPQNFTYLYGGPQNFTYSYGGLQNFIFIYMVVHKISFLLIWWSTKFHFYLYGGSHNFTFIYIGVSQDRPCNRKKFCLQKV